MKTEQMIEMLESNKYPFDRAELTAIARRLRLLAEVAEVWRTQRDQKSVPATFDALKQAMEALDADEREGRSE
jgi:hypothetical protein